MSRIRICPPTQSEPSRGRLTLGGATRRLIAAALLVALAPSPAHAQFGMLKKLKKAASGPDSASRAKDSLEQIAKGVSPDSVKIGRSLLARGVSAASSASNKLEETTGISAKDAALAATGIGATNLIAKKMGVDPMSMGSAVMNNAKANAKQRAMNAATGATGVGAMPGAQGAAMMQGMQGMQSKMMGMAGGLPGGMTGMPAAGARAKVPSGAAMGMAGMPGVTQADAEALVAFQQEMMQVAMQASTGDAAAKARLEAWQALTVKHEGEIQKLSLQAQGGDVAAMQKLQMMQFTIMKEWASTGSTKAKVLRAVKP
jgi:hypothetical protein